MLQLERDKLIFNLQTDGKGSRWRWKVEMVEAAGGEGGFIFTLQADVGSLRWRCRVECFAG